MQAESRKLIKARGRVRCKIGQERSRGMRTVTWRRRKRETRRGN